MIASIERGRVGSSMEIGFVTGSGSLDQKSGLDLRLVDDASVPARDDTVVTWGSATGPYAPGVPIGTIAWRGTRSTSATRWRSRACG